MALKRIGALWNNENPKTKTRHSGKIELGALGELDIITLGNEKQDEKHPDLTIHLIMPEEPEKK